LQSQNHRKYFLANYFFTIFVEVLWSFFTDYLYSKWI